jgi:hypothetical protein
MNGGDFDFWHYSGDADNDMPRTDEQAWNSKGRAALQYNVLES